MELPILRTVRVHAPTCFSHPSVSLSSFINLVAKVKIFIKLIMYVLSHGCLLNSYKAFLHMIIHVMWLHFQWLQMSLHSLCLLFMRILVLRFFPCIPRCFHLLHDGTMNFSVGLDTAPWHHSYWTSLPFLLGGWTVLHQWCHYTHHIILCLWIVVTCSSEQVSFFFACRWLCMRSFLQVKCSCMVRKIS